MKLEVEKNYNERCTKLWVTDQRGNQKVLIGYNGEHLIQQDVIHTEAREYKPLLSLPDEYAEEFIKAVVNYASQRNIKTENENLLKGKLEATERHLSDLQKAFNTLLKQVENPPLTALTESMSQQSITDMIVRGVRDAKFEIPNENVNDDDRKY